MAKAVLKNYTFNTSTKAITLTDIATVRLDKIILITDVTTNKILYSFADPTIATATVATNVITLSVLQGGENNTDKLRIDYDVESTSTSAFIDGVQPIMQAATAFIASVVNSTVAQLAAAATFTGTIESIFNQQAVSILLTSDQNGTLTINQYIDLAGTKKISAWTYTIVAGVPFSRNFVGNGNYFNLSFQNTGGSTTTTLAIDTAYGTLPAATNLGNGPVSLDEVNGTALILGQRAAALSLPVTLSNENVQDLYVTGQAAQTALINNIIPATAGASATDATGYRSGSIQIVSTGTAGGFIFEYSNDNVNFNTMPVWSSTILSGTPITAAITPTASATIYIFPIPARYIRVRISTAVTGGTIQAFTKLSQVPYSPTTYQIAQATAGNLNATVQPGNTANTTAWLANPLTPAVTTTGDTGAKTATGNSATRTNATAKGAAIIINMGAVTGTTPTAVLKVQGSADGGTTWYDVPGATTASLVATGVYGIVVYPGITPVAGTTTTGTTAAVAQTLPRSWRLVWTIGGTTPSFTITNVQVSYLI